MVLLVVGAALTGAGVAQQQEGGYFSTPTARLSTTTSALVTREIDVDARRPADTAVDLGDLGRVRLRATSTSDVEMFLGIAATADVERYLRDSAYEEMTSYELDPFRVQYRRSAGQGRPPAPTDQAFWVATAVGSDDLELQWDKRGGAWTAVAMNADGRPGVDGTVDLGLRFGFLLPLGVAGLAGGLFGLGLAVAAGRRRRRFAPDRAVDPVAARRRLR